MDLQADCLGSACVHIFASDFLEVKVKSEPQGPKKATQGESCEKSEAGPVIEGGGKPVLFSGEHEH